MFKSAAGFARGGNKARLGRRERVLLRVLETSRGSLGQRIAELRETSWEMLVVTTLQIAPRETRRNARSSLRGRALGAITSVVMELNVVIAKLKNDNTVWQRDGYY